MTDRPDIGHGISIALKTGTSSYTVIGHVLDITPPNPVTNMVDVTTTEGTRDQRYMPALTAPGECTVEYLFTPGGTAEEMIDGQRIEEQASGEPGEWRVTFNNGRKWEFAAFVVSNEVSAPIDDKMTGTLTLQITGALTKADAPGEGD